MSKWSLEKGKLTLRESVLVWKESGFGFSHLQDIGGFLSGGFGLKFGELLFFLFGKSLLYYYKPFSGVMSYLAYQEMCYNIILHGYYHIDVSNSYWCVDYRLRLVDLLPERDPIWNHWGKAINLQFFENKGSIMEWSEALALSMDLRGNYFTGIKESLSFFYYNFCLLTPEFLDCPWMRPTEDQFTKYAKSGNFVSGVAVWVGYPGPNFGTSSRSVVTESNVLKFGPYEVGIKRLQYLDYSLKGSTEVGNKDLVGRMYGDIACQILVLYGRQARGHEFVILGVHCGLSAGILERLLKDNVNYNDRCQGKEFSLKLCYLDVRGSYNWLELKTVYKYTSDRAVTEMVFSETFQFVKPSYKDSDEEALGRVHYIKIVGISLLINNVKFGGDITRVIEIPRPLPLRGIRFSHLQL
jgi:hypothetical protein